MDTLAGNYGKPLEILAAPLGAAGDVPVLGQLGYVCWTLLPSVCQGLDRA